MVASLIHEKHAYFASQLLISHLVNSLSIVIYGSDFLSLTSLMSASFQISEVT